MINNSRFSQKFRDDDDYLRPSQGKPLEEHKEEVIVDKPLQIQGGNKNKLNALVTKVPEVKAPVMQKQNSDPPFELNKASSYVSDGSEPVTIVH